jgi:hypothetical protein
MDGADTERGRTARLLRSLRGTTATPGPREVPLRELTVHIGMDKTGTTSTQKFLATNRRRLAETGLLYPRSPGSPRHTRVSLSVKTDAQLAQTRAWYAQAASDPDEMRRAFRRGLQREIARSGAERMLLSDEVLYACPDDAVVRLGELGRRLARRVRVVVYLRRQDDHLLSGYQEVVKGGSALRLDEYAAGDLSRTYDYRRRLAQWQDLMAPDELVVRPFDRARFPEGSLLHDFLDACAVPVPVEDLEPTSDRNASLDAEAVEFLRLYNLHRQRVDGVPPPRVRNREVRKRLRSLPRGPVLTLPEATLDAFMECWQESNRAVARTHLADPGGELFPTDRGVRSATTEQHLEPARLEEIMAAVDLPEEDRDPLRRLAAQEASAPER